MTPNRNTTKRLLSLLLATLMLCSLPLYALAEEAAAEETPESIKFIDVALLVKQNNLQLKNNEMSLLNLTSNDKLGEAQGALAASASMLGQMGANTPPTSVMENTYYNSNALMLMQQAASMSPTPLQVDLVKLQLEQAGMQIQQAGETVYYNMVRLQDGLEKARRSRPLLEQTLLLAETAESVGMGTALETLRTRLMLSELDATISGLELNANSLNYNFNTLLGRKFDSPFTLQALPAPDLEYYDAIVLETDLTAVVKSNYTLRYLQRERENIKSDDYDATAREKQIKDNEIEMETQSLKASLSMLYHTIADNRVKLENEQVRLQLAQSDAATAQTAFAAGQISELQLKQAREQLNAQEDAVRSAEQTLFWNIRRYQWAMTGLPLSNGQ